jgi:sugar-specific transcriptional regulator TrmB
MPDVSQLLRSLGLLESEVKTYLASLARGPLPASELSRVAALSRQSTYSAIDGLEQRGLMTRVERDGMMIFNAEPPSKLLEYAKRHEMDISSRVKDLEGALPDLELQTGCNRPVVKFFEGKEGIRALHEEVLREDCGVMHVDELTDREAMRKVITIDDLEPLRRDAATRETTSLGLYAGDLFLPNAGIRSERYVLPEEMWGFNSQIQVIREKTVFMTFGGKVHSIIIEDLSIANALRNLFRLARKALRERQETHQVTREEVERLD